MAINTIEFLIFAMAVCAIYFVVPKKVKWIVLLLASYIYYFIASGRLTIFLIITTISIYLLALALNKVDDKTKEICKDLEKDEKKKLKAKANKKKKWLVVVAILINFGVLLTLKYANFFGGNINSLLSKLGINLTIPKFNFILPLGISYYTLQAISYVIDVYRGKYRADKNLGRVALFTSFFPQMTEGPIGRYDDLAMQLYEPHKFNYNNVKFGIQLMVWGFFKKMVIADRAGIFVNTVFADFAQYHGIEIFMAVALYTIQIYAEFSGCIDIVRGLAQVLGINMAENFKRPFFSKSVQEFWRRWHITLGTWLKDYVFYPVSFSGACIKLTEKAKKLGKFVAKFVPAAFALFFVWFGNGLWHGASWKYVFYGLYYYVIMMIGLLIEPLFRKVPDNKGTNVLKILRTWIFVIIGMTIFKADSITDAFNVLKSIFIGNSFSALDFGLTYIDFAIIFIYLIVLFVIGYLEEKGKNVIDSIVLGCGIKKYIVYYILIVLYVSVAQLDRASPF